MCKKGDTDSTNDSSRAVVITERVKCSMNDDDDKVFPNENNFIDVLLNSCSTVFIPQAIYSI